MKFVDLAADEVSDPVFGRIAPKTKIRGNKRNGYISFAVQDKGKSDKTNNSRVCPCCEQSHRLFKCQRFKALSVKNRLSFVRQKLLCELFW